MSTIRMSRRTRSRAQKRPDEAAVSNVLGAVLMFGLLVLTLVTIQVKFVPVWDQDRESRMADAVSTQFAHIKAELDRQASNGTTSPVTLPLTLGSQSGFRLFRSYSLPGTTGYESAPGNAFEFSATEITIQESEGVPYFGLQEVWSDFSDGQTLTDVERVHHLRVMVPDPLTVSNQRTARIEVRDANNVFTGALEIKRGGDAMYVYTYNAASQVISIRLDDTDPESWDSNGPDFFFNLLDDNVLFTGILDSTVAPMKLTLVNPGGSGIPSADFNIVYDKRTSGGIERIGGDIGLRVPNFAAAAEGGALRTELPNQRFPPQVYTLEHGAIIREQPDGSVMAVPPSFSPRRTPNQATIAWAIPTILGDEAGISSRETSITMAPLSNALSVSAFAPRFTVTLGTDYPALWTSFWSERLDAAGFLTGEYTVATTASTATLTVFGPIASPSSTVNDIVLDIRQANIDLDIRATG